MKKSLFKSQLIQLTLLTGLTTTNLFTEPGLHAQNLPILGEAGREDLSPVMERKLGEEIMSGFRNDSDYIDDEIVSEYLNNFGSKLLEVHQEARGEANMDFYFFAVRDKTINAFALPGGFIGVHSALILLAQNESQLASVLSHEIGHVAQRHIAQMIGQQKQDMLIPLASLILAALTLRSNPDAAMALAVGGQGLTAQRQLDFSQHAEREADRVGLQILRDGGFDPSGMVAFFERMQNSFRSSSDSIPAFLRTHPMTSERIADIENRIREERFKQHVDEPEFQLLMSRMRVLQDESTQGLIDTKAVFQEEIRISKTLHKPATAAEYGLALVAFKQSDFKDAKLYLDKAKKSAGNPHSNPFFSSLGLAILLGNNEDNEALKQAEYAIQAFPTSHGIGRQYVDALLANHQAEKAVAYLRDQILLYRKDANLHKLLARAYAATHQEALEHMALAESYTLSGAISPALDQLDIARRSSDASFYDLAIIDARERELKEKYKDDLERMNGKSEK